MNTTSQSEPNFNEITAALRLINENLQQSNALLKSFSRDLIGITKEVSGTTFEDAAIAATMFAQQGLSVEDVLNRTRDALILSKAAGISTNKAVDALAPYTSQ